MRIVVSAKHANPSNTTDRPIDLVAPDGIDTSKGRKEVEERVPRKKRRGEARRNGEREGRVVAVYF